ncbi:MAG: DUF58 domain-containing protein [Coriobacteriales bacterium]|nr:DUF58 domain-containing protein [Coriobacteriales bacterium]
MRAFLTIVTSLGALYAGGMFGVPALMVLGLSLGIVTLVCGILTYWQRAHTNFAFLSENSEVKRGDKATFSLTVSCSCSLGIDRFLVTAYTQYRDGIAEPQYYYADGSIPGNGSAKRIIVYGVPHCGIVEATVSNLRIEGPLGIFRPRIKTESEPLTSSVIVVPRAAKPVPVSSDSGSPTSARLEHSDDSAPGNEPPDIYDMRPWIYGDTLRDVHWKLSARTGELMVKRHVSNLDAAAVLLLNATGKRGATAPPFQTNVNQHTGTGTPDANAPEPDLLPEQTVMTPSELDAWYETAANLSSGMHAAGIRHYVVWETAGTVCEMLVCTPSDLAKLYRELVLAPPSFWHIPGCDPWTQACALSNPMLPLVLDANRTLISGNLELAHFDLHGELLEDKQTVVLVNVEARPERSNYGSEVQQ